MKFINDETVIGKWNNIGTIKEYDDPLESLHEKDGEFEDVYFLPEGVGYWIFEGWSKGMLMIHYGGDEPVRSYNYSIRQIQGKEYLYLELENRIEVFRNIDHIQYSKDTLGRHDHIDLPFVMDEKVLGKWQSCGFVNDIDEFQGIKQYDLCLSDVEFLPEGWLIQHYMDSIWDDQWTKGFVLNLHRQTAARYKVKTIEGQEYLFVQWKMGNYIYGGLENEYYVFERV